MNFNIKIMKNSLKLSCDRTIRFSEDLRSNLPLLPALAGEEVHNIIPAYYSSRF